MIVYGRHPVIDYITSGKPVEKVLIQKNLDKDFFYQVQRLCKEQGIALQVVPKEKLHRSTKENHQGIIATIPLITYQNLNDVLSEVQRSDRSPLFLILDNITDVRNFGSIARSAECMGVHAIIIPSHGAAPVNDISMKTSAGALARIPICKSPKLAQAIIDLQMKDIVVYASSLKASKSISDCDFTGGTAIILGSEDRGVQKYLLNCADESFIIPQIGQTDSLNVSVANGVVLYEVDRQRRIE